MTHLGMPDAMEHSIQRVLGHFICVFMCHSASAPDVDLSVFVQFQASLNALSVQAVAVIVSFCVVDSMMLQPQAPVWFPERQDRFVRQVLW